MIFDYMSVVLTSSFSFLLLFRRTLKSSQQQSKTSRRRHQVANTLSLLDKLVYVVFIADTRLGQASA
jgi:hypothetical protein